MRGQHRRAEYLPRSVLDLRFTSAQGSLQSGGKGRPFADDLTSEFTIYPRGWVSLLWN